MWVRDNFNGWAAYKMFNNSSLNSECNVLIVQIHILKNSLFFSLTLQLIIHDICYIDINILELLAFRNRC